MEAAMLEQLSESDALTGLLNRRALESRFRVLRSSGFNTFAIIDLDNFKVVNDRHGHAVGDDVLVACAGALAPDYDTLSFRLGGEEFLLLLRGKGVLQRAEAGRRAITTRIARDVEGLERPVTASMGIVEVPPEAAPHAEFAELYARADALLYETKQAGRNRTINGRMKLVVPGKPDRRAAA